MRDHEIITVTAGSPEFQQVFATVFADPAIGERMWQDSETRPAELLGRQPADPARPKHVTVAVVDGEAATWAAHQVVDEDGETVVKCTDSYDRPGSRHLQLYPAVYAARQALIEALCAELGLDATTYVYVDPLWLHTGWRIIQSGVSRVPGLDEHRWYLLRWEHRAA